MTGFGATCETTVVLHVSTSFSLYIISDTTLRDSLSNRQWSRSLKIGPIGCPETPRTNYQSRLCNIAEEQRPHNRSASPKSHIEQLRQKLIQYALVVRVYTRY